jgi:hypothetical protein
MKILLEREIYKMTKEQLLELLKTIKVDKEEFWLLSTGALTLRGIYKEARDLDIAVTDKGLEQLNQNYQLKKKENDWYIVTDKIECVCDGKKENLKYQPELVGDYYVQNLHEYLEFLEGSSRKKDQDKIEIVKKYIK